MRRYISRFSDSMEVRTTAETVTHHLDQHQPRFQRCEEPMAVREMDDQTYVLTLGQFGNFGFEIEPTIALKMLPQKNNIYRLETVEGDHAIDQSAQPLRRRF